MPEDRDQLMGGGEHPDRREAADVVDDDIGSAPDDGAVEEFDVGRGLDRLRAGLRRLRDDPAEALRIETLADLAEIDAGVQISPDDGPWRHSPRPASHYGVGVEVRPHGFEVVAVDHLGRPLADRWYGLSGMHDVDEVVAAIAAGVDDVLRAALGSDHPSEQVALCCQLGGPVDTATGTVRFYRKTPHDHSGPSAVPEWKDVPLGPALERATNLPSVVENDANAFAVLERWSGVGVTTGNFLVLVMREGFGGSFYRDGQLFSGPMEIGHLITAEMQNPSAWYETDDDSRLLGTLESVAGITGLLRAVELALRERVADLDDAIERCQHDGSGRGTAAFKASGICIANAMAHMVHVANPSDVVLYAPDPLLREGRHATEAFLEQIRGFRQGIGFDAFKGCQLHLRPTEPHDGAQGAALIALERCWGLTSSEITMHQGVAR